ncbi:aldo/keto reductase [Streptomyces albidoflavus]|nr:aldo/keto reductase [Streptomyces albidoflavus]WJK70530.1 aldo/keto reductase [Streptomyces albidoflavus]WSU19242.1 aldo/keto reductase [Streptomyces albidoflavus]
MSAGRASAHRSPTTGGLAGLYDTAPFYGAGLAELRLGELLSRQPRDTYVLSTKVGRVVLDEVEDPAARELGEKGRLFAHGRPNRMVDDYSADATLRSVEDSLKRLGTDRPDIVWVHDIAPGLPRRPLAPPLRDSPHRRLPRAVEAARRRRHRGLGARRQQGRADRAHPRPGRTPARRLPPRGPLHPPRPRPRPPAPAASLAEIVERVRRIRETAERHGVGVKAAALQFSLAHPASAAVIPGTTRPSRVAEDVAALHEEVPAAFWADLRASGLVSAAAPLPA